MRLRPDGKNGDFGGAENLVCDGAEEEFAEIAAAMGSGKDAAGAGLTRDGRNLLAREAVGDVGIASDAKQARGGDQIDAGDASSKGMARASRASPPPGGMT